MLKFHVESVTYVNTGHWLFTRYVIDSRISTVALPEGYGYETCLFRRIGNKYDSEVIEHYETLDAAMAGHYHHAKFYGFTTIKIKH
jgi:hypothetical protein